MRAHRVPPIEAEVGIFREHGVDRGDIFTAESLLQLFAKDAEKVWSVLQAKALFGGNLRLEDRSHA